MNKIEWRCGPECDFWEADDRAVDFGWCKAPLPWEILWNVGDMLHTDTGDECGFTLEHMIEAQAAWVPVIAARRKAEETEQVLYEIGDNCPACGAYIFCAEGVCLCPVCEWHPQNACAKCGHLEEEVQE